MTTTFIIIIVFLWFGSVRNLKGRRKLIFFSLLLIFVVCEMDIYRFRNVLYCKRVSLVSLYGLFWWWLHVRETHLFIKLIRFVCLFVWWLFFCLYFCLHWLIDIIFNVCICTLTIFVHFGKHMRYKREWERKDRKNNNYSKYI